MGIMLLNKYELKWSVGRQLGLLILMMLLTMASAYAQETTVTTGANVAGLCTLLAWLKAAVAVTAIIAGVIMVMNSQFAGKSAFIGELCTNIILGCVVVGVLGYLVTATGLSPSCS